MHDTRRPENADEVRDEVQKGYTRVAEQASTCSGGALPHAAEVGRKIGYTETQLQSVPDGRTSASAAAIPRRSTP